MDKYEKVREYKVGEIIVCDGTVGFGASAWIRGSMYKISSIDTNGSILRVMYEQSASFGVYNCSVRLATDFEEYYFQQGVKNVEDIPKDQIVENYSTY